MKISNVTQSELERALEKTNAAFQGNITFNELRQLNAKGTRWAVTLRTNGYDKPGYRRGCHANENGTRRRMPSACWHAYGTFVDTVFELRPDAKVHNIRTGKMDTADSWYWHDWNIGSIMSPMYYSEACDCWEKGYDGKDR